MEIGLTHGCARLPRRSAPRSPNSDSLDGPVAVDRLDTLGFLALQRAGLDLVEWGTTVETAREIKTAEEIKLLKINGAIGDAVLVSGCPPLPTTLDCLACHERADAAILRVRSPSGGHLIADLQSRAPSPIA
jgi:Xaa-Pro aminopeptidase